MNLETLGEMGPTLTRVLSSMSKLETRNLSRRDHPLTAAPCYRDRHRGRDRDRDGVRCRDSGIDRDRDRDGDGDR